jgi:hypothetical protein
MSQVIDSSDLEIWMPFEDEWKKIREAITEVSESRVSDVSLTFSNVSLRKRYLSLLATTICVSYVSVVRVRVLLYGPNLTLLYPAFCSRRSGSAQLGLTQAHAGSTSAWKFVVEPENGLLRNGTYPRNGIPPISLSGTAKCPQFQRPLSASY